MRKSLLLAAVLGIEVSVMAATGEDLHEDLVASICNVLAC